jgi:hypothetical protein
MSGWALVRVIGVGTAVIAGMVRFGTPYSSGLDALLLIYLFSSVALCAMLLLAFRSMDRARPALVPEDASEVRRPAGLTARPG